MLRNCPIKRSTIWLNILLSGCAVAPPDIIACKALDPIQIKNRDGSIARTVDSPACRDHVGQGSCGRCTYTISDRTFYVGDQPEHRYNGKTWTELKDKSVILPARESYAPLKAYIINSCKVVNCDATISNWRFKLDSLEQPARK